MNRVTKSNRNTSYDVDALRNGDRQEMATLVREEGERVYRCIARLIDDPDEARSLVQETFLQAMLKFSTFRGESKVSTWLCSIGINLARGSLRKGKRLSVLSEDVFQSLQPRFSDAGHHANNYEAWQPVKASETAEMKRFVHNAINRLPDAYRTAILLKDIEELPGSDVANMLGITEGALRVRLHRARNALRGLLDEYYREH